MIKIQIIDYQSITKCWIGDAKRQFIFVKWMICSQVDLARLHADFFRI